MVASFQRTRNIQIVFIVCAVVLILKAAQLQLIDTSFRRAADATTIHRMTIYPPRGLVYDRYGKLLLSNDVMYDLMVTVSQMNPKMDTTKFCLLVGITKDEFKQNLNKDYRSGRFSRKVPFVFLKKITTQLYARLQESLYEFPGFFVQVRSIRGYPYNAGAHVLGYINEVDNRDIERGNGVYTTGDYIGSAGLESQYEDQVRGKKGVNFLLKDNLGRIVDSYDGGSADTAAVAGADIISSIDAELQAYAEHLMQNKTGSVVAIEPSTGEILTMVSAPTYNPNLLMMTQSRGEVFSQLLNDPLKPFFDRTVMAKYPPGSIFKTVVTLAGLQEGTLYPESGVGCAGGYFYAGRLYKCHHHAGVGNVVDALANSCNTYYFREFRNVVDKFGFSNAGQGLDVFVKYAREFGLGQQLGIDYPNESAGNIPDTKYYDKIYPKRLGGWHSPTIMSVGIGQGELQLTTLQMANLAACIANRGYWYAPHLAKAFKDPHVKIPERFTMRHQSSVERRYFDMVVEGMAQCVVRGTARIAAIPDMQVCGKTGTSQNPHGEDHSVFFAFAPKDNPKIAVAVYVENAGWGASYAAPIASLVIEKYLRRSILPERLHIEERMVKSNLIDRYLAIAANNQPPAVPPNAPPPPRDTLEPTVRPSDNEGGALPPPNATNTGVKRGRR